ncbi:MAG: CPBP family intramembrane glutamic endopeptidase [Saprospiraceae bacterium]
MEGRATSLRALGYLLGLMLFGMFFGNLLSALVFMQAGLDPSQLLGSEGGGMSRFTRDALRLSTLLTHLCTFSIPALGLAYAWYREGWQAGMGLGRPRHWAVLLYGMGFVAIGFPLAQYLYWWNLQFPLPPTLEAMERSAGEVVKAFIVMDGPMELVLNLCIVGFVAAFGEELVFRAWVQPRLHAQLRNDHVAVWLTALLFSAIHFQFAGFLPRMLLGGLLGYLYLWGRNLWVPIAAHFFFNSAQLVAQYFFAEKMDQIDPEKIDQPHGLVGIIPLLLLVWAGREIKKRA